MRFDRDDPEVFENAVASLVDMASILVAYQIGVSKFGIGVGMLYAMFDAFIVIWMRKPISRFAKSISPFRLQRKVQPSKEGGELESPNVEGTMPAAGSPTASPMAQSFRAVEPPARPFAVSPVCISGIGQIELQPNPQLGKLT